MNRKIITALEVTAIVGLILYVFWIGGVFRPAPEPTVTPTLLVMGDLPSPTATRTRAPTQTYTPAPPTPTFPPRTTPAGLIAFDTTRDGNSEIYVMNADGTNVHNLTNNAADDAWPSWSPDGKQIAFLSVRSGWQELYVMEADGSNVRQISHLAQTNWSYQEPIRWSPDGQQILVMAYRMWTSHTYIRPRLDLVQTDGSETRIVFQEKTSFVRKMSWVPASQGVLLGIVDDATGTCQIRLFTRVIVQYQPLFSLCVSFTPSPDGEQIAISSGSVNVFNLGNPTPNKLNGTQNADGDLYWSPDGRYIVYPTISGPSYQAAYADGSGALKFTLLLNNRDELSWSPDSQWLAYDNDDSDNRSDISIINLFDDAHPIRLTNSGDNYAPAWQPRP